MKIWTVLIALVMVMASVDADAARRFGGGKSFGRQSGNVTQREAAPAAPAGGNAAQNAAPTNANSAAAARPAPAAPAAAQARKPWGAMLGGLAAGLGLAWLAHSLGLGAAFGQFLLIALVVLAVMVIIGIVRSRRNSQTQNTSSPYAFQGAGSASEATAPVSYSADKVGNDSSARPWERNSMSFDSTKYPTDAASSATGGVVIGSALAGSAGNNALTGAQGWGVPAGFDSDSFLEAAKRNFVTLQEAWDRSDISTLRSMMTDDMVGEIRTQLADRENHLDGQPNKTDVIMLNAQLLGIEEAEGDYLASVEFSGMIREQPSAGPSPFREVWNMVKPKDGRSGWLVGGVQALA